MIEKTTLARTLALHASGRLEHAVRLEKQHAHTQVPYHVVITDPVAVERTPAAAVEAYCRVLRMTLPRHRQTAERLAQGRDPIVAAETRIGDQRQIQLGVNAAGEWLCEGPWTTYDAAVRRMLDLIRQRLGRVLGA